MMLGKLPVSGLIIVGQGLTALAVGAGRVIWTFFSLNDHVSHLFPSLWETARCRLKSCVKGSQRAVKPKLTN